MAERREPNKDPVENRRGKDTLQHETIQPHGEPGSEVMSDQDLFDVATEVNLSYEDLTSLYIVLGISHVDVLDAELEKKRAGVDSFKLQAVNVLRLWRMRIGYQATKKALLDAMSTCEFLQAKQMLENKWGIAAFLHDMQAISEKEILEVVMTSDLSYAERKALYMILGIKKSEVEAVERKAGEGNFVIQTINLLQSWKNRNGESATKQALLDAIGECRMMVAAKEDESQNIPTFNLKSVRSQLQQEYLETRGKLQLLPGMPEEFARLEDLFVDLHMVEEEKIPTGVICKELRTYGDIVCITQEVEKDGRKVKKEVKRVLVRGPPGVGKSTAISKLAYDWARDNQDSSISKFQLLFVITINEIKASTDLVGAIQDQLLPKVTRQNLEVYLQSNASSVAILFDGYDEASIHFHQSRDIKDVLCSKWLSEACVIVTTRPNQVGRFSQNYGPYVQVEILGFSDHKRKELYVQKFMGTVQYSASEFLNRLHESSHLTQIASIPIILSMLCLVWAEDHKLPSTITGLYREVITHLAKHSYAKTQHQDLDMTHIHSQINRVLNDIGKVAIDGLFEDRLVFTSSEFGQKSLDEGCELGVVTKEKKRSRLNVTHNVTFLHKTFQEICAAHFWATLVETEPDQFQTYLEKMNQGNIFEMGYLLRFACGLSLKAAEIILLHVVHIMCHHPQLIRHNNYLKYFYNNPCQQLPIVLLFETELNNAQLGHCFNLHRHLKPLITTLSIAFPCPQRTSNFQEILTAYISSQQSIRNERKDDCNLWFDDVEKVDLKDLFNVMRSTLPVTDAEAVDKAASCKLVCAMSNVAILHIDGDFIENLSSNHFSGASLSKLHLQNVKCEINQFSQFLSTIPSLSQFILHGVSLNGHLIGKISIPMVNELHIEGESYFKNIDITLLKMFMVNRYTVTPLTQLHCSDVKCDAKMFAQFASCMSSLTKLTLKNVLLNGELSGAIHLPAMKELHLYDDDISWSIEAQKAYKAILCGYGQTADMITRHCQETGHRNKELVAVSTCIPVERMKIRTTDGLSHMPVSVCNLIKAMKYMLHLRCLDLSRGYLDPCDCEQLFDALIVASKNMHTCNHENKCISGVGSESGLLLEELDLSENKIGDSIGKFVIAYGYMPHLKCLKMNGVSMKTHHWQRLFDSFIKAGQTRNGSLALDTLDLSFNQIGDSLGKLAQAYRYMKHLKNSEHIDTQLCQSECAQLFAGFISAGQSSREPDGVEPSVLLALENLDMCGNINRGDSVGELAQAYRYLTRLRTLRLKQGNLTTSNCAVLFDGFITAGKMLSQDESSSNAQGDASSTPQTGLSIEVLILSGNETNEMDGELVDKLLEALTYMPHLQLLCFDRDTLDWESTDKIKQCFKRYQYYFPDKIRFEEIK